MRLYRAAVPAACLFVLAVLYPAMSSASGRAPTAKQCKAHPTDPVTIGGCLVIDKKMGNCVACHEIAGTSMDGNVGPALKNVPALMGSKERAFQQIWDPEKYNPNTAMPPFGKDRILTRKQIHDVVEFLWTL